jgi:hypothetical protein
MKKPNRASFVLMTSAFAMICIALAATSSSAQTPAPADAKKIIAPRARAAILALKTRNMVRLSQLVHPIKGVRFSPYYFINTEKGGDRTVTRTQVRNLFTDKRRHLWGEEDASGDKLWMTFATYYRQYVYDHDFANAKDVAYNDRPMGGGNMPHNMRDVYPNSITVEYHFSGFEEKFGGMDWRSLWLVFDKHGSQWFLVGIAHGEWTI